MAQTESAISFSGLTKIYRVAAESGTSRSGRAGRDLRLPLTQRRRQDIFTAYQPPKALEEGAGDPVRIGVLVGIIAVCVAGSLFLFRRRDAIP